MFGKYLFRLYVAYILAKRCAMKACFTAMLLPWLMMANLPTTSNPIANAINGNSVTRHSDFGQLTETIDNPPPLHGPGHDYGAIGDESDPPMSSPAISPFTYTVNGFTVVRRSELGALTGTIDNSLLTRGPGHDFGVIGDEYKSAMSMPTTSPFTYTVNGFTVVRRSELGPLN